jgi:hypothetical protein
VLLDSSRKGEDLNGRRYDVVVTATDRAGNQVAASIAIIVPHDQRK